MRKYIDQRTLSRVEASNCVSDIIESYSANGYGRYAMRDKTILKIFGIYGFLLNAMGIDCGYRYRTTSWGNGMTCEVAKVVFDFGTKTTGLNPVLSGVHPKNYTFEKSEKTEISFA